MNAARNHVDQINRTNLAVQAAVVELEQLAQYEPSRALSLAITNAQQAAMWHGWHEGEQGRYVNPYPTADHSRPHFATGGVVARFPTASGPLRQFPTGASGPLRQHHQRDSGG